MKIPPLTIATEITDRPNTAKFTLNRLIAGEHSRSYADRESAAGDPLASGLFEIKGVRSLLVRENFIVVTKAGNVAWPDLIGRAEEVIREELAGVGKGNLRVPHGRAPGSGVWHRQLPTGVRVRIAPELRMIVGWLLAALSMAQLFWIFPTWDTSRREVLLIRLAGSLALLLFWLIFTEKKKE